MTTIEERAKDFADRGLQNNIEGAIYHTYIYAANEQQKIDIDKACEWLYECVGTGEQFKKTLVEKFRKAMEE